MFSKLCRDKKGASGIEYALLCAMVAVVLAGYMSEIQHSVNAIFTNINVALSKG